MALQNLISTSLNLTDNLMVGQLGEKALGALALANQLTFLAILFLYGIGSGAAVFASQYWGARDLGGVRRTQGAVLVLAVVPALVFGALCSLFPEVLLGFYTNDPETRALGATYLRISGLGFPLIAVTIGFSMLLRSTGQVRIPLVMTVIALVVNISLNYLLIFGWGPVPALGVAGSALGTVVARLVEATGIVALSYGLGTANAGRLGELFHFSRAFLKKFLTVGLPVLVNDFGWALGMTTLMAVYAHLGSASLAAVSITDTLGQFLALFLFASVNATATVTGNLVGAGRLFRTRLLVRRTLRFAVALGIVLGLILLASSPWLPGLFRIGPEARSLASATLVVFAFLLPFRSLLYHQTVGLFRGAGDTKFPMVLEVGGVWLLGLPPALLVAQVFHGPVWAVFAAAVANEAFLAVGATFRFRNVGWIKPVTVPVSPE
jgi:putative MATE family efflux protein